MKAATASSCFRVGWIQLTENKRQLTSTQLLDLITVVEQNVDAIKPLLQLVTSNPTVSMNDILTFDRIARERLGRLTRMLIAAASEKDFSTINFLLDEGGEK